MDEPAGKFALAVLVGMASFVAGVSATVAAIISSYGGLNGAVKCLDPNDALCTGLFYGYGLPGTVPLVVGGVALLIAAVAIGFLITRPVAP